MEEVVLLEKKPKVASLYLNRPEAKNALNPEVFEKMLKLLIELEKDNSVQVVVLEGQGDFFSSGADLKWMREGKEFLKDGELLFDLLYKIFTFQKVLISAVNGPAFGGALGFISASDFAIAKDGLKFAFSEVRLGIAPAIISPFVLNKVNFGWAKKYFLSGKAFSSIEGKEGGLFEEVFSNETFEYEKNKIIEELLKGGPQAQKKIKELFLFKKADEILKLKDFLCNTLLELRSSKEGQEGLLAFFQKRSPKWQRES